MAEPDDWVILPGQRTDPTDWVEGPPPTTPPTARITVGRPDKYQQAALEDRQRMENAGTLFSAAPGGYGMLAGQGATLGWGDEFANVGNVIPQMIRQKTWDPREAYKYAKAESDLALQKSRELPGAMAAELAGGLSTGAGVLGAGTRAARPLVNYLANTGKATAGGAVAGAGYAENLEDVPSEAGAGATMGAILGGAVFPTAALAWRTAGRPVVNMFRNPETVTTERLAQKMRDAGVAPHQLAERVEAGSAAGQPYTVADVLGKEGERALAPLAKTPGEQRNAISEFLTERALNMPERVGGRVGEALGAPTTSKAAKDALVTKASIEAAPIYRAAEKIPTWSERLQPFLEDPIAQAGLRNGVRLQRLRNAGTDQPFHPYDANLKIYDDGRITISGVPNMQTLHTLKVGLDRMIEDAVNPATGRLNAEGNAIRGFRDRMLAEIDALNPTYAEARRVYGGPMQVKRAVERGQEMARVGRHEDTVPEFYNMPPTEQQGARIGYADQVRAQLERGNYPTILREKSAKGRNELAALSLEARRHGEPYDPLRMFLNREEQMQRTNQAALGGSQTYENLADAAAAPGGLKAALGLAGSTVRGSLSGMASHGLQLLQGYAQPEAQRVALARMLLARDRDQAQAMADRIAEQELRRRGVNPLINEPLPRWGFWGPVTTPRKPVPPRYAP
jgi:hypothetical protein